MTYHFAVVYIVNSQTHPPPSLCSPSPQASSTYNNTFFWLRLSSGLLRLLARLFLLRYSIHKSGGSLYQRARMAFFVRLCLIFFPCCSTLVNLLHRKLARGTVSARSSSYFSLLSAHVVHRSKTNPYTVHYHIALFSCNEMAQLLP